MVCPVVIRAHQHQVGQLGGPTVLPMLDVMGVQTPGGPTTGNHTRAVAMLKRPGWPHNREPHTCGRDAQAPDATDD